MLFLEPVLLSFFDSDANAIAITIIRSCTIRLFWPLRYKYNVNINTILKTIVNWHRQSNLIFALFLTALLKKLRRSKQGDSVTTTFKVSHAACLKKVGKVPLSLTLSLSNEKEVEKF